jgi:EAL domain-containing protein (putative c-di-GMP-specific phosphodiesterase class I)
MEHYPTNCLKVFCPLSQNRFFPSRFILRDPAVKGVTKAFNNGYDVSLIVFNINNMSELIKSYGEYRIAALIQTIRNVFRDVVKREVKKEDLLLLDSYYYEGITLFIKVDHEKHSVSDIHTMMEKIALETNDILQSSLTEIIPDFNKGYMFIDKNYFSLPDSIYKAYQQALTMAEKRVQTQYNEMMFEFNKVIAKKDIHLLAQPIIDVNTNKMIALEMLTRGPVGTNLEMPLRLFSVARQIGSLYDLEMVVFEKTFEKLKETGYDHHLFINCTPLTLGNKRFMERMKQLLNQFPMINPNKLILEMTEQDSIEIKKDLIDNIAKLRQMGFRVALDDTGAGYSSFHTIGEILPEIIKIDRDVIQNIHQNSVKESMLKGILLVAKEVGSLVVAEGIEKIEEAKVISQHKVDLAQGYYYARPSVFNKQLLISLFGG